LNINNGGGAADNSAIGTGPLTLGSGAQIDNTSGQSVTLQPTIAQSWLDNWTFIGSTNLNTGAGAITLGKSVVVLTVISNTLEIGGAISDDWKAYKLQKAGDGSLALGVDNTFSGGMQLNAGLLQLKTANALGYGVFTISGSASIDNISGADMTLSGVPSVTLPTSGTVTYLGTSNSLSFGSLDVNQSGQGTKILDVVNNTLTFGGNFTSGNSTIVKTGQGKLILAGSGVSQFVGVVNEGELELAHDFNPAIGTGASASGILVQSNAVARLAGTLANQIPNDVETRLNEGGVFDMNGNSETIGMLSMTNGVLRNGLAGSASTLTAANGVVLEGGANVFDVPDQYAGLDIIGDVTGAGSVIKAGLGYVTFQGANAYNGNTTVSGGALTINSPLLAAASTVAVDMGAKLNLNFPGGETNVVSALILGGVTKTNGIYNSATDPLYLGGAGSLQVVPYVATNPTNIIIGISIDGALSLSWPADHLGWTLQTNAVSVASSESWFPYPGSALVTNVTIGIDPAATNIFFRMVYP
jgi:autotransporter-associated beta strand protein